MSTRRRRYAIGRCGDCGWHKRVTRAVWWVSGFSMLLCKDCIKPYRPQLLKPCAPGCTHCEKVIYG